MYEYIKWQEPNILQAACHTYLKKQAELLPPEQELSSQYVFSKRFNKRMRIAMHSKAACCPARRRHFPRKKVMRRLIAAALAACLLICTASLVPAIQMRPSSSAAMVIDTRQEQGYTMYLQLSRKNWTALSVPQTIETVYLPTYVPDGYAMKEGLYQQYHYIVKSTYTQTGAQNNKQEAIRYSQTPLVYNINVILGSAEGSRTEYIAIGRQNGIFFQQSNGSWTLFWNDGCYLYQLYGDTSFSSQAKLVQMAKSLKKI